MRSSKIIFLVSSLIVVMVVASLGFGFKNTPSIKATQAGFAVVELFTSEGCSSCPAADAVVAELLSKKIKNVYVLGYHVDYWNRLGWKDEFSQAAFSARQQQYAKHLAGEGVYTPQVIVNGAVQFVGSNQNALSNAVTKGLNSSTESNLQITAEKKNNEIVISYKLAGDKGLLLNSAIVQPEAITAVKNGENSGRTLHHVNIVSALLVSEAKGSGEITVKLDKELQNKPLKVIVYSQDKQTFKILGADEVEIKAG